MSLPQGFRCSLGFLCYIAYTTLIIISISTTAGVEGAGGLKSTAACVKGDGGLGSTVASAAEGVSGPASLGAGVGTGAGGNESTAADVGASAGAAAGAVGPCLTTAVMISVCTVAFALLVKRLPTSRLQHPFVRQRTFRLGS